jgi:hypothetical protein
MAGVRSPRTLSHIPNGYAVEPSKTYAHRIQKDDESARPIPRESHPIARAVDSTFAASEII